MIRTGLIYVIVEKCLRSLEHDVELTITVTKRSRHLIHAGIMGWECYDPMNVEHHVMPLSIVTGYEKIYL